MGWNHVGQLGESNESEIAVQVRSGGVIAMSRGMHVLYFLNQITLYGRVDGVDITDFFRRWEWNKSISPIQPRLQSISEQAFVPENK